MASLRARRRGGPLMLPGDARPEVDGTEATLRMTSSFRARTDGSVTPATSSIASPDTGRSLGRKRSSIRFGLPESSRKHPSRQAKRRGTVDRRHVQVSSGVTDRVAQLQRQEAVRTGTSQRASSAGVKGRERRSIVTLDTNDIQDMAQLLGIQGQLGAGKQEEEQLPEVSYDVSLKPSYNRRSGMWQQVRQSQRVLQRIKWGQELSHVVDEAARRTPSQFDFAKTVGESKERMAELRQRLQNAEENAHRWEAREVNAMQRALEAEKALLAAASSGPSFEELAKLDIGSILVSNKATICKDCSGCVLCRGLTVERDVHTSDDQAIQAVFAFAAGAGMKAGKVKELGPYRRFLRRLRTGEAISDANEHLRSVAQRSDVLQARRAASLEAGIVEVTKAALALADTSPRAGSPIPGGSPTSVGSRTRAHSSGGSSDSHSTVYSGVTGLDAPKIAITVNGQPVNDTSETRAPRVRQRRMSSVQIEAQTAQATKKGRKELGHSIEASLEGEQMNVPAPTTHSAGTRITYGQLVAFQASDGRFLTLRRGTTRMRAGAGSIMKRRRFAGDIRLDVYDGVPTWCTTASNWPRINEVEQCTVFRLVNANNVHDTGTIKDGHKIVLEVADNPEWLLGSRLALQRAASDPTYIRKTRTSKLDPLPDPKASDSPELNDAAAPPSPTQPAALAPSAVVAEPGDSFWRPAAIPMVPAAPKPGSAEAEEQASESRRNERIAKHWSLRVVTEDTQQFVNALANSGTETSIDASRSSRGNLLDKLLDKTDVCHHTIISLQQDWGHLTVGGMDNTLTDVPEDAVTAAVLTREDQRGMGTVVVSSEPIRHREEAGTGGGAATPAASPTPASPSRKSSSDPDPADLLGATVTTLSAGVRVASASERSKLGVGNAQPFASTAVAIASHDLTVPRTEHAKQLRRAGRQDTTTRYAGALGKQEPEEPSLSRQRFERRDALESTAPTHAEEREARTKRALESTGRRALADEPRVSVKGMWRICLCNKPKNSFAAGGTTDGSAGAYAKVMNKATSQLEATDAANATFSVERLRLRSSMTAAKTKKTRLEHWGRRMHLARTEVQYTEEVGGRYLKQYRLRDQEGPTKSRLSGSTSDDSENEDPDNDESPMGQQKSTFHERHGFSFKDLYASASEDQQHATKRNFALLRRSRSQIRKLGDSSKSVKQEQSQSKRRLSIAEVTEEEREIPFLLQNPRAYPAHRARLLAAEANAKAIAASMLVPTRAWEQMNKKTLALEMLAKNARVLASIKALQRCWRRYRSKKWHRRIVRTDMLVQSDLKNEAEEIARRKRLADAAQKAQNKRPETPPFKKPLEQQEDSDAWIGFSDESEAELGGDDQAAPIDAPRDVHAIDSDDSVDGTQWPVLQSAKRSALMGKPTRSSEAATELARELIDVANGVNKQMKGQQVVPPSVEDAERRALEAVAHPEVGDEAQHTVDHDDSAEGYIEPPSLLMPDKLEGGDGADSDADITSMDHWVAKSLPLGVSLTLLAQHNREVFGDAGEPGSALHTLLTGRSSQPPLLSSRAESHGPASVASADVGRPISGKSTATSRPRTGTSRRRKVRGRSKHNAEIHGQNTGEVGLGRPVSAPNLRSSRSRLHGNADGQQTGPTGSAQRRMAHSSSAVAHQGTSTDAGTQPSQGRHGRGGRSRVLPKSAGHRSVGDSEQRREGDRHGQTTRTAMTSRRGLTKQLSLKSMGKSSSMRSILSTTSRPTSGGSRPSTGRSNPSPTLGPSMKLYATQRSANAAAGDRRRPRTAPIRPRGPQAGDQSLPQGRIVRRSQSGRIVDARQQHGAASASAKSPARAASQAGKGRPMTSKGRLEHKAELESNSQEAVIVINRSEVERRADSILRDVDASLPVGKGLLYNTSVAR